MEIHTVLLLFVVCGYGKAGRYVVPEDKINYGQVYGRFADDMWWATASAAYQIEGGWDADGKTPSIWDTESHVMPSVIADNSTGDVACDSYHKWQMDIDNMAAMGVNAYRLSISWNRIFPSSTMEINKAGVAYYRKLLQALKAHNIQPMVTMYHWDLPQYMQDKGGLLSVDFADDFYYYADALYYVFGDLVQHWFTFNEPASFAIQGYMGFFAPTVPVCPHCPYLANKHLLIAHANAYRLYNRKYKPTQRGIVGIVLGINDQRPKSDSQEDIDAADRAMTWSAGVYMEPIFGSGNWPKLMRDITEKRYGSVNISNPLPKLYKDEQLHIQGTYDFIGVNIYTADLITDAATPVLPPNYYSDAMGIQSQDPDWPSSASPWLKFVPSAVPRVIDYVRGWGDQLAIYITECGWSNKPADSLLDRSRIKFYRYYIGAALYSYQTTHANIKAFTAWSLMDNFEWRAGFTQRFGLHYVDFSSPNRTRTAKQSVAFYTNTVRNNGFVGGQTSTTTTTNSSTTTTTTNSSTTTTTSSSGGCNCPTNVFSGQTGHIESPNYPLNYCNSFYCQYHIEVEHNYIIQARFMVNVADGDELTIAESECPSISALPLQGSVDRTFYTNTNTLSFSFKTNDTGSGQGWEMVWKALPDPVNGLESTKNSLIVPTPPVYSNHMSTDWTASESESSSNMSIDCGQMNYFASHGIVKLPSYGHPYKNNMMCPYRIQVEPGFIVQVRLLGSTSQTPTNNDDGLTVFDNFCIHYLMGSASGKNFDVSFHSTGPSMGLVWRTDTTGTDGTGFIAFWDAIPKLAKPAQPNPVIIPTQTEGCKCPPEKYYYVGIMQTSNYPDSYCNNQDCNYYIETTANMTLKLRVWGNTWEGFDTVSINGSSEGTIILSGYFDKTMYMTSNTATVLFHSDSVAVRPGFRAFYQPCQLQQDGSYACQFEEEELRTSNNPLNVDDYELEEWISTV